MAKKLKCSDCHYYRHVEISDARDHYHCLNPDIVAKSNPANIEAGFMNASAARRFDKYCGKNASQFLEAELIASDSEGVVEAVADSSESIDIPDIEEAIDKLADIIDPEKTIQKLMPYSSAIFAVAAVAACVLVYVKYF